MKKLYIALAFAIAFLLLFPYLGIRFTAQNEQPQAIFNKVTPLDHPASNLKNDSEKKDVNKSNTENKLSDIEDILKK